MAKHDKTFPVVKDYYGATLSGARDLATKAAARSEPVPRAQKTILGEIDPEVLARFCGCGTPIPPCLDGLTALDLGCGAGRDAFLLSRLVGARGFVFGVDMTPELLDLARRHRIAQAEKFGFPRSNVEFLEGRFEDLAALGIANASIDLVISNCALNLSPEKERVFAEIFRVLKPGGELYFSDVFADRRPPSHLRDDAVLVGECLAGAMYVEDFRRMLSRLGCPCYRVVAKAPAQIDNPEVKARVGAIAFQSMTVRAFKLASLEDVGEDYGQVATYLGGISEYPHGFPLDVRHLLPTHKPIRVSGNTAAMLSETRYAKHFQLIGDRSRHFGRFDFPPARL